MASVVAFIKGIVELGGLFKQLLGFVKDILKKKKAADLSKAIADVRTAKTSEDKKKAIRKLNDTIS